MQRIIAHIEHLLLSHDCVIIPAFGGFVLQAVPAVHSPEEHVFRPMCKDILFNSTLNHQDGLLAESYMKMYGVNYAKAVEMVEEDVEFLIRRLRETGQMDMGMIGTLSVEEENRLIFSSAKDNLLSVGAYGLPSFYFAPLSLLRKEQSELFIPIYNQEAKKKDAIYIRINRNVLRAGAAVAAVAAFVLLISTPIKDVNPSTYTASFIPTELSAPKVLPVTETEIAETASFETVIEAETVSTPEPQPVVLRTGKTYYIVIGSFPNVESGNKFLSEVDRVSYPNVNLVEKGDKVRVYSNKFDNREEAESYLSVIRQTENYKDAWLFISR